MNYKEQIKIISVFNVFTDPVTSFHWNTTGITVAGVVGSSGSTADKLNMPWGLFIDPNDTLYVADQVNHRIQKFLKGTNLGVTVAGQASGTSGNGPAHLLNPAGVLLDVNGNVYVADSGNHRIQLWKVNATSGVTIAGNGRQYL